MEAQMKSPLLTKSPFKTILSFSVPLFIGDFCQQLYNAIDSIIAGRFIGTSALASLGSAGPIMNIVIFLLIGFAMGIGVIMSRHFGEKDYVTLTKVNTKDSLLNDADNYLKIVFAGAIFTYLYNFYCFAVRAIGDSYTPLIFLFVSVIINGILDVLFVVAFKWGIEGTALATVLAQMLSSALCIIYTGKKFAMLRLKRKDLKVDGKIVWEITSYSLSMSIQQVFVYVGRIAIQGLVNTYPEKVVAGVNSGTRLDALLQTPMRGYTNALTTYTAQNMGAKKYSRVTKGYKASLIVVAVVGALSTLITVFFAEYMVKLFDSDAEVIAAGKGYLVDIGCGYLLMCIIVQSQAVFKGIGMLKTFVVSTFISIVFRIGLSYLFEHFWGLDGMFWAPTASWIVGSTYCLTAMLIAYKKILKPLENAEFVMNSSGGEEYKESDDI